MSAEATYDRILELTTLLSHDMDQHLKALDLTVARTHLLWELRRLGPSSQQELAAALQVSPRNVTALIDGLEATGFVIRAAHPTDRRALRILFTEKGEDVMARMANDHAELLKYLFDGIDSATLAQFDQTLSLLLDRVRAAVGS